MKSLKRLVALGLVLAFGAGQQAWAAQQQEDDSVYRWGRWAVLSPAAGGDSYEGEVTPDAANNARPSDASAFQPVVAGVGIPPVQPPIFESPIVTDVDPNIPIVTRPPTVRVPPGASEPPTLVDANPGAPIVTRPPTVRTPPGASPN